VVELEVGVNGGEGGVSRMSDVVGVMMWCSTLAPAVMEGARDGVGVELRGGVDGAADDTRCGVPRS